VTWWDFADLSTLAQNSDGSGAVAANGDAVGYVRDKAGSANLTQTTNNLRGSLVASGIGGRASVSLPNTSGAGWQFTGTPRTDNTIFIVARYTGAATQWLTINAGGNFFIDATQTGGTGQTPYFTGLAGTPTYRVNRAAVTATRGALFTACGVNASYLLTIRGANFSENASMSWPSTTNAWRLSTYTSFGFIGQFAEIAWYSRSLGTNEISAVEGHLRTKWGLP
jgi:hypothetical protein